MTKKHEPSIQQSNFWSGLAMGVIFGASSLYLLGTKNGRQFIRKLLDATENLEEMGESVIDEVQNYFSEDHSEQPEASEAEQESMSGVKTVESVIEKIQSVIPEPKTIKKYFEKEGKPLK